MNCEQVREQFLEMASGGPMEAAVQTHLHACAACAAHFDETRKTMALLDEWRAPEPSPYFDQRLAARLREEKQREVAAPWWRAWQRPAMAAALLVLVAAGAVLYRANDVTQPAEQNLAQRQQAPAGKALNQPAEAKVSAVKELQELEANHELYAEFDLLDEPLAEAEERNP